MYMLNQAAGDRAILAKQLNISPHQISYVTGGYFEKTGKTYDCVAVLDDTGGQFVNFTMEFAAKKK